MEFSITNESCRVCLRKTPTGKYLSEPAKGKEHVEKHTLLDLYHLCTGFSGPSWLQLETNTFYPRKICTVCERLLLAAYELRKQSAKSEKVLRNILHFYEDDEVFSVLEESIQESQLQDDFEDGVEDEQNSVQDEAAVEDEQSTMVADDPALRLLQEPALLISQKSPSDIHIDEQCEKDELLQEKGNKRQESEIAGTEIEEQEGYENMEHPNDATINESFAEELVLEEYTVEATVETEFDIEPMPDEDDEEEVDAGGVLYELKEPCNPNFTHCPDCGKLVSVRYLSKHRDTHLNTQRYECDICKMRFTFQENLSKHKRIHQNDKRYKCSYCQELFLHWASRRYHIERVHTKQKRFACEYCGAMFRQSSHYHVHLRRHTGSTPFACSLCDRTFITKYSLKDHMLSHSDKKDFSCMHCCRLYKTMKSLRVHMKTHSDTKEYICSVCEKTFTQNHSLRTHHMKAHPEFELPPSGTISNIKAISRLKNVEELQRGDD